MNQVTLHKTIGRFVFLVSLLVFLLGPSQVLGAEGITGDWEITMDFNGWQAFAKLSVSKNADGTLAGKWGTSDLSDIKFKDQKLTRDRVAIISHMMMEALGNELDGVSVALLDVRNSKLHVFDSPGPALAPLLEGEALAFCRMYQGPRA